MKIEQQLIENHQVKLTVEVDSSKLEDAKHKAARHIAQHKKIAGFRPGKAPYQIVLRNYGEEIILDEALDILVKDLYPKVIEESKVKPYGPGALENVPTLEPLTFVFTVPLEPEVVLGDYKNIRLPYKLKAVSKKDVAKVLEDLQERQVVLEPSSQPAKEGDQVYIKLSITRLQPAEGELPSLVKDRRIPVVVLSNSTKKDEWPFPGFSKFLIGLSNNEEKNFIYTYPEDSEYKDLRGKTVDVSVLVEEVKKRILPDLTDEFAQSVGEQYENLTILTDEIRKSLELQAKEEYDNQYNDKIMEKLLKDSVVKYPPQMLDRETDIFVQQLENRLTQQKMDLETYLKIRKIDMESLKSELKPQAEERLRRTLVLLEIARLENIKVENNEIEKESMRTLDELGRMLPPNEARKTLTNEFVRGMIGNIGADLLVKHTWDYLQSIARGEIVEPAVETLTQPSIQEEVSPEINKQSKKKKSNRKVDLNEQN